ncbi:MULTISPECIES: FAD-dependent oxidoreductase [Bifidobacterium]|uniref:FAD-dependent oxidoreductase n=1 Tax=Bifidobacterium tibiigranuli TaxID=2172043 RepID=A0A5N6RY65_9BIFI|nr:FAD-dependent oxidoreductase [Bifidobacterium tibiigranuli]KAE8126311.1 FAD-dependent oxidoreductase [Bifidobacterium tibiigranuli]KAE8127712.1 FAD-dependent oxidoreductase [Bifidobacterium tibiigranuli]
MSEPKKIIVVGSSHGGYEAVQQVLQDAPDAEIQWYEKGSFLSFLSCGMQLYLEGVVKDVNSVRYATEEGESAKGVHVFTQQEVVSVAATRYSVHVVDHATGDERDESYDRLILSPGAVPASIPVEGNDLANIYAMRGRDWAIKLKAATVNPDINDVVIIGAGYIGIEAAEVFAKAGKRVTVIEMQSRVLAAYLDSEFTDILADTLSEHGITPATGQRVQRFEGVDGKIARVVTDKATYPADLVIESAGVRANTDWLDGVVERDEHGLIVVDDHQATSVADIYAVGDATEVRFAPTGGKAHIALATNARRQGRIAARNALGEDVSFTPVSGSSALSVFEYKFASTGIKEYTASDYGVTAKSVFVGDLYRPPFVPDDAGNAPVYFKLTYAPEDGRVLGAQIMSTQNVTANINTIALAIQLHATVQDLAYADFFFQPGLNRPWSIINIAAQQAARGIGR